MSRNDFIQSTMGQMRAKDPNVSDQEAFTRAYEMYAGLGGRDLCNTAEEAYAQFQRSQGNGAKPGPAARSPSDDSLDRALDSAAQLAAQCVPQIISAIGELSRGTCLSDLAGFVAQLGLPQLSCNDIVQSCFGGEQNKERGGRA